MILGTIVSVARTVGVTVQIDGESAPTEKKYMWLLPYYPKTGDRVLIEEISGTYVILGKVSTEYRDGEVFKADYLRNNSNNVQTNTQLLSFGYSNGTLYYGYLAPGGSYSWHALQNG